MHPTPAPFAKDLLLAGGGHSHALLARLLTMRPMPGVRTTMVSDVTHAPYSGMLPGYVAGLYTFDEAHIDLRRLCDAAGIRFVKAVVTGLDAKQNKVYLDGRPALRYDVLSINTGSIPARHSVPGATAFAIPSKPVSDFLTGWDRVLKAHAQAPGKLLRLTIVGAGAGGVELSLCMQARLGAGARITLVEREVEIMAAHARRTQTILRRVLRDRGITVLTGAPVAAVEEHVITLASGEVVPHDYLFWVTAPRPQEWIARSGLKLTADGFIAVAKTLQAEGFPAIFAAGDTASISGAARPKSGVFAVRQAKPLNENIRRYLRGVALVTYRPQRHYLSLIGTADRSAVASRGSFAARSRLWWSVKDHIDRSFMASFAQLLPMPASGHVEPVDSSMAQTVSALALRAAQRCGGCAAKVGGDVLARALARALAEQPASAQAVPASKQEHTFVMGLSQRDDAAAFAVPPGQVLVQSVDFLTPLVSDPYTFGRLATVHAVSDIYATGAEPHSLLALVNVPLASSAVMEDDIVQMLAGVLAAARTVGAVLIGGHTTETREAGLGITVNGLAWSVGLKTKSGLVAGDAIILTKALGTGTLFAAAMRLAAKGRWIDAALASMLTPNTDAARVFAEAGAHAVTDVTGFGLAGHLLEMLTASQLDARLELAAVPVLDGAEETLRQGFTSTLQASNEQRRGSLRLSQAAAQSARLPLLFDPQTSGGLLAGLATEQAAAAVAALKACGLPAAIIGHVVARSHKGDSWIDVS